MSTGSGPLWPAVPSRTWRLVAVSKVKFVWNIYCRLHADSVLPFLHWDYFSLVDQCSWTVSPGSMGSCLTALQLWQMSLRFSSHRAFPGSCHKQMSQRFLLMPPHQCPMLNTRQEKTPSCHLTVALSVPLMTHIPNLTAPLTGSVRTFNQRCCSVCCVLHYSVTSTSIHCDFPLRLTGLASWSSTTSWMPPPCFQCWLCTSGTGRRFWIFALPLEAKP